MGISAAALSTVQSSAALLDAVEQRRARLVGLLKMNPGRTFARPQGWVGNRPFYQSGVYKWDDGIMDPDGMFGDAPTDSRGGTLVTSSPTGPEETRVNPLAWDLPAEADTSNYDPIGTTHSYGYFAGTLVGDEMQRPGGPVTAGPVTGQLIADGMEAARNAWNGIIPPASSPVIPTSTPMAKFIPTASDIKPSIPYATPAMLNANRPNTDSPANQRYLVDGQYQDGNGNPVPLPGNPSGNTNIPAGGGNVQQLPGMSIVATSYQKYLPYLAIAAVLLVLYFATKKKSA